MKPVVDEHMTIYEVLRACDPVVARQARRMHLTTVLDGLQFAIEEYAVDEAKCAVRKKREPHMKLTA